MTRKEAAMKVLQLYNSMEARPVEFSTIYRGLKRLDNGNWHYCGRGYDYTV